MLRRGSAGSLSDAAANEQETRRRDSMRRQPSAGQAAAKGLPRPHQNSRRLREEEEDNGVLGTWAGRQRFFSDHLRQEEEERQQQQQQQQRQQRGGMPPLPPPTAGAAAAAAAQEAGGPSEREAELPYVAPPRTETPVVLAPPPLPLRANDHPSGATLDAEMNAAWRWRFTRKWQAEQMKQFDGPAPPGPNGLAEGEDEEEWAAALRLMDAVDGGLNMQIGRTLSLQNSSMVDASSMGLDHSLLMSPGLSQLLLEGSIKEVRWRWGWRCVGGCGTWGGMGGSRNVCWCCLERCDAGNGGWDSRDSLCATSLSPVSHSKALLPPVYLHLSAAEPAAG